MGVAYLFYGFIMINLLSLSSYCELSLVEIPGERMSLPLGPAVCCFSRLIAKTLHGFHCCNAVRPSARSRTQAVAVIDQVMGQNGGRGEREAMSRSVFSLSTRHPSDLLCLLL